MTPPSQTNRDAALVLVHGSDEFLVAEEAKSWVDQWVPPEERSLGLEIIEPESDLDEPTAQALAQTVEGVQTVGLFGGAKTVWLRGIHLGPEALKRKGTKSALDPLTQAVKAGLPEGVRLLVSGRKVDARSGFFKAIKARGVVREHSAPDKPWQMADYAEEAVMSRFQARGVRPGPGVVQALVERVGGDTRQLDAEIEKLLVYAGDRPLTPADVQAMAVATREAIVFEWTDAFCERNLPRTLSLLRHLRDQGEEPQLLLSMMERTVGQLLILRECMRRKWVRIAGQGRRENLEWSVPGEGEVLFESLDRRIDPRAMHPYRGLLLARKAARFSIRELAAMQRRLMEVHEQSHSSSLDVFQSLEVLMVEMLAGRR